MIKRWMMFIVMALVLFPVGVKAQSSPTIESMEIDLWPEYDRPSILVIYHVFLPAGTSLPVTMNFLIPAAAGDPYNVAAREESDGQLYNISYKRVAQGDLALISFTTSSIEVQFEYYDPRLIKQGATRNYAFEWQGDYTVKTLTLQVQQPVSSSQMNIKPPLGEGVLGEGGIMYYNGAVGPLAAGTKYQLAIDYEKSSDVLSSSVLKVQPSAPITTQTTGRAPSPNIVLIAILSGLGGILVAVGIVWIWQLRKHPAGQGEARKRHTVRSERSTEFTATPVEVEDRMFCYQCGRGAEKGDVFCRVCGTKLRKE